MKKKLVSRLLTLALATTMIVGSTVAVYATDEGGACEHTGGSATCTSGPICDTCNEEYGSPAGHSGGTATCTTKAECGTCGDEYGEFASHSFSVDSPTCANCDAENPDYVDNSGEECTHELGYVATTPKYEDGSDEAVGFVDIWNCDCGQNEEERSHSHMWTDWEIAECESTETTTVYWRYCEGCYDNDYKSVSKAAPVKNSDTKKEEKVEVKKAPVVDEKAVAEKKVVTTIETSFDKEVEDAIAEALEIEVNAEATGVEVEKTIDANGNVVRPTAEVNMGTYHSMNDKFYDKIGTAMESGKINVSVECTYNGKAYKFNITPENYKTFEGIKWYGPLFMESIYGNALDVTE